MEEKTKDIEYPKAQLYKRWFSTILDAFLAIVIGSLLFMLTSFTTRNIPSYQNVLSERLAIQVESRLYDENGDYIIDVINNSTASAQEKKEDLRQRLDYFYTDSFFFKDSTAYDQYQGRKRDYKTSEGQSIFTDDGNGNYVEGNFQAQLYLDFYTEECGSYGTALLSVNDDYQRTGRIIIWTSVIEIFICLGIGYAIAFNLMPVILKRGRQTVGMYLFKISLITGDALTPAGKTFVFRQLLIFFIGYALTVATAFVPLLVSLTMMHTSKAGQDFYDYMTGTYVVDSSKRDVYLSMEEYNTRNKFRDEASIENKDMNLTNH